MSYEDRSFGDRGDRDPRELRQPQNYNDNIVSNGIPKIRVIGVGGAGNNAVNRMIDARITSAEYIAVNTDAQVLLCSQAPTKIQIGVKRTRGLGAGADPEVGREAAEESKDQLARAIDGTDLLFITAGMGGGTGTGAAPVIAKIAQDKHILTVAVVTEPFAFEGRRKLDNALKGISELRKYVDTLVIIPNEKIREVVDRSATVNEAFSIADDVLRQGIRGIADLIVTPGLINCDFADVRTVLEDKGLAHMGVGVAKGENRIVEAVKLAVNSPLLETTIEGAKGIIVNVVGGSDLTLDEVGTAMDLIHGVVDFNAMIIPGACIDPNIQDEVEVTVIATGFPEAEKYFERPAAQTQPPQPPRPQPQLPRQPIDPRDAQELLYGRGPVQPAQPVQPPRPQGTQPYSRPADPAQPVQPQAPYAPPAQNPYQQPQQPVQPQAPYAQPQAPYAPPAQNPYQQPQPPAQTQSQDAYPPAQAPYTPARPADPYAQPGPQDPRGTYPTAPTAQPAATPDDADADYDPDGKHLPPFVKRLFGKK